MVLSLPALLVILLIAAVCGAIGSGIAGARVSLLMATALGFIGAILGPIVAHALGLREPLVVYVSGHPFPVLWSIIGAALLVALLHLSSRRRLVRRRL